MAVGHHCRGDMMMPSRVHPELTDGNERTRPDCKLQQEH
jgi:hypothetical protein